jgi:hypothetical protein
MIYDTQSNEIAGINVYDLKRTPEVGQTSKLTLTPPNTLARALRIRSQTVLVLAANIKSVALSQR